MEMYQGDFLGTVIEPILYSPTSPFKISSCRISLSKYSLVPREAGGGKRFEFRGRQPAWALHSDGILYVLVLLRARI